MKCIYHLCDNELKGKQKQYCSVKCRSKKKVKEWRIRTKLRSIEYKGGCCQVCGYDRYIGALEFHHRDLTQKDFGIAAAGHCRAWEKIQAELDKCDLLCANCHREAHANI